MQRAVGHQHAVVFIEIRMAEIRERNEVFDPLYGAETRVGERKILRYGQHHRVGQRCCQLVEFAHRHGADPRVETGEDVQNDALALQAAQGERSEVGFDQLEVGGRSARCDEVTGEMYRHVLEFCRCHSLSVLIRIG